MKRITLCFVFVLSLILLRTAAAYEPTTDMEFLPELVLTVPEDKEDRDYLGLTGKAGSSFFVADIKADILLIELFSMYCPYCQQEAPNVNELYQRMEEVSGKGVTIKIIGLGAANSQFEVQHFRDTYQVPFPLFPDMEKVMYKALSAKGTPTFIGCRLAGQERKPIIVLRKGGGFYSPEKFFKELLEKSGYRR